MPLLSPQYFSTWYMFTDGSVYRLLESWSEKEIEDVKPIKLLQGDGGTHVMDIGGLKWETTVKSPVIIFESGGSQNITSIFDLLKTSFQVVQSPYPPLNIDYVLKNGTISFDQAGVYCELSYVSSVEGAFTPIYDMPYDFIARKARFYDTFFNMLDDEITQTFQIISGRINFEVDIDENYFINTGSQAPYFGVKGYHIRGSVTVLVNPHMQGFQALRATSQQSNVLDIVNAQTSLSVGGVSLRLGQGQIRGTIERSMSPSQAIQGVVNFDTYSSRNLLV